MSRRSSSDGWNKKREADWILFNRSAAFRCILLNRPGIEEALGARPMKVLPVRYVARLFAISERLLWKWIERKVLCTYHRPSKHPEHYKKGIAVRTVRGFLQRLERCEEIRAQVERYTWIPQPRTRPRSAPAKAKCQEGEEALYHWNPTPRQYAEAVGVSVSTVYRLLREGRLSSYRPTKKRIVLCDFFHKNRNKLLTRKTRQKRRGSLKKP